MEFYFSDSNLYRDNFLHAQVEANPDGFVDLSLLATFSRMQALLGTAPGEAAKVPEDIIAAVAAALKDSTALVISDDARRVRRAKPLTKTAEEAAEEADARSLYVGPFPFDIQLDTLVKFFGEVGDCNAVRMRRHGTSKDFKGSVFVEFGSLEEAERVKALDLEHAGAKLHLEAKLDYMKRKEDERHARPNSPHNIAAPAAAVAAAPKPTRASTGAAKRPREEDGAEDAGGDAEAAAAGPDEAVMEPFTSGCVIRFDFGVDTDFVDPVTFGLVKDSFGGKEVGLSYVDYTTGENVGHARFATPEGAAAAMADAEGGKRLIAGYEAAVVVLEGEEEAAYMKVMSAKRAEAGKAREAGGGGGRRGGGRGRGRGRGRGGGRGRGRDNKRPRN